MFRIENAMWARAGCLSGCLLVLAVPACMKVDLSQRSVDSDAVYFVRSGDTLSDVGKRYAIDYHLLARRNRIRPPYTLYVGQRLSLWHTAPSYSHMPIPRSSPHITAVKSKRHDSARSLKSGKKSAEKKFSVAGSKPFVSLHWPAKGRVSSRFGRLGQRMHDGIDIAAPEGAPVYAAAAGEVVYADRHLTGYGKLIIIRHRRNQFTAYAHNQRNLVRRGDHVAAGDLIARIGHTGHSSSPNLHFEIRRGSTPVDPLVYLPKEALNKP